MLRSFSKTKIRILSEAQVFVVCCWIKANSRKHYKGSRGFCQDLITQERARTLYWKPHRARRWTELRIYFTVLPNSSNWKLTAKEAVFLGSLVAALKLYIAIRALVAIFYDKRKKIVLFILMNYKCNWTLIEETFVGWKKYSTCSNKENCLLNFWNHTIESTVWR